MPANSYHFVSHWRVDGTVQEVADILDDAESLSRWWGAVYSNVELIDQDGAEGLGKTFRLLGKGWLPYTLHLTFRRIDNRYPNGFSVAVSGDLNGSGVWSFAQTGPSVDVNFDWTVSADKAILRWSSPIFKPVFASNHRWTMRRGEESLRLELRRRRAKTPKESAQVPLPPQPFTIGGKWLALVAAATLATAIGFLRLRRRSS